MSIFNDILTMHNLSKTDIPSSSASTYSVATVLAILGIATKTITYNSVTVTAV